MRLIDVDAITDDEIISYLGIRYASCKEDIRDMLDKQPTLDEKEIIRKVFERVVERLNEIISNLDNKNKICMDIGDFKSSDRYSDRMCEVIKCKEIVMEEGGIE